MRDIIQRVEEALKPSQYRKLVKGWDKERYAEIFKDPAYEHDRNGYRVFIPIGQPTRVVQSIQPPAEIQKVLSDAGYDIQDYVQGIVVNREKKQQIKLGKVLTKLKRDDLLQQFNNDSRREGTKKQYMVVISRHPYDIAGMSTDRGWTSCMNLENGVNRHYVPLDIEAGTVVAYITSSTDPDLKNPTGRVLIKPYYNVLDQDSQVYFGIEDSVYGTDVNGFTDAVKKWVNMVNTKYHGLSEVVMTELDATLYPDNRSSKIKVMSPNGDDTSEITELLQKHPEQIVKFIEHYGFPSIEEVDNGKLVLEYWSSLYMLGRNIGYDTLVRFTELADSNGEFELDWDDEDIEDIVDLKRADYEEVLRYLTEKDLKKIAADLGINGNVNDPKTIYAILDDIRKSKYEEHLRTAMNRSAVPKMSKKEMDQVLNLILWSINDGLGYVEGLEFDTKYDHVRAVVDLDDAIYGITSAASDDDEVDYFWREAQYSGEYWFSGFGQNEAKERLRENMQEAKDSKDDENYPLVKIWPFLGVDTNKTTTKLEIDYQLAANIFTKHMQYNESHAIIIKRAKRLNG